MSFDEPRARRWKRFFNCESGAITVDWIVLTATVVFLGMAAAFYVGASVPELADSLRAYLTGVDVGAN